MDEFVLYFTDDIELTPIEIVSEITGLTYEEIRSCSEIIKIDIETNEVINHEKQHKNQNYKA